MKIEFIEKQEKSPQMMATIFRVVARFPKSQKTKNRIYQVNHAIPDIELVRLKNDTERMQKAIRRQLYHKMLDHILDEENVL